MDHFSIKKYAQKECLNKEAVKNYREFIDFYINDNFLTDILNDFYDQKSSILENWIGVLGFFQNKAFEIIKIKQLLGLNISDEEIRSVYPASMTDSEFNNYLNNEREELENPAILIYCCAQCGDYYCGGIAVWIEMNDHSVKWKMYGKENSLTFEFDKNQYFEVLKERLAYLERLS